MGKETQIVIRYKDGDAFSITDMDGNTHPVDTLLLLTSWKKESVNYSFCGYREDLENMIFGLWDKLSNDNDDLAEDLVRASMEILRAAKAKEEDLDEDEPESAH
jgi:hypothetical protein